MIIGVGIYAGTKITSSSQWSGGDKTMGAFAIGAVLGAWQIGGMSIVGAAQNGYTKMCIRDSVQVMIVPIQQNKEGVLDKAYELKEVLSGFKVKVDDSDKSPGWKFSESEMRGIPVRVEIGPRDLAENQAVLVRRDTHEKITVSLDEINEKVAELLGTIQHLSLIHI